MALQPFIKCYLEIYMGQSGEDLGCVLPAKLEQCIFFSTDTVADIGMPLLSSDRTRITSEDRCCYVRGSVRNSTLHLQINGVLAMFVVIFKPTGFYRFFKMPAHHFSDTFTHADLSLGKDWESLGRLIRETKTIDEKVMLTEKHMTSLMRKTLMPTGYIDDLIARLPTTPNISVYQMARQSFLSERHFRRKFLERTGLDPQTFARICRGNLAIKMKKSNPALSWRSIAFDIGYTDQSHFRKEMRALMGLANSTQSADQRFIDVQGTNFRILEHRE